MPIVVQQLVNLNPQTAEEHIGYVLYQSCMAHFNEFLGQIGIGFGYDGCNASVAITAHVEYGTIRDVPRLQDVFGVAYGTSRLFSGLDPDFNRLHNNVAPNRPFSSSNLGEHAEQSAIRTIVSRGIQLFQYNGNCHIYIDFNPCNLCSQWLQARQENWFIHYGADLQNQHPLINEKKRKRRASFGRMFEPALKKIKR